jgi:uncharacterized protein with HEPN domain
MTNSRPTDFSVLLSSDSSKGSARPLDVPEGVKAAETSIPWPKIIDFGNRLRHAYHSVDPKIVWQIATADLEPLRIFVERIIRREEKN